MVLFFSVYHTQVRYLRSRAEMMILAVASVPFRLQVSFVARVMSQLAM